MSTTILLLSLESFHFLYSHHNSLLALLPIEHFEDINGSLSPAALAILDEQDEIGVETESIAKEVLYLHPQFKRIRDRFDVLLYLLLSPRFDSGLWSLPPIRKRKCDLVAELALSVRLCPIFIFMRRLDSSEEF